MTGVYIVAESIFIITAIIVVSYFSSSMISAVQDIEQSQKLRLNRIKESIDTQIRIIYATGESGGLSLTFWAKNIGERGLTSGIIRSADLFLIGRSSFMHLTYGDTPPSWNYTLVRDINSDAVWSPGETIKITVALSNPIIPGEYHIRLVIGAAQAEYVFSVG